EPNWANAANSRYCARSSFKVEPTCLTALMAAEKPTRETERPTLTAGRTPELNRSVSKKIWPSVIEITFVGMYAETSPAWVSMTGKAVNDPPPRLSLILEERSSNRE